jgi:GNAT superfamily N-acetyltransferase
VTVPTRVEIRAARPDEIAAAHDLEVRCYAAAEAASLSRFRERHARFPKGFLLLFEDDLLRALLCAVKTNLDDLGDDFIKAEGGHDEAGRDLVVLSVATDPAHRRRGFAGLLVDELTARAPSMHVARIRLVCKAPLVPFYARHGYRHVGPSSSRHGGAKWEEMELRVAQRSGPTITTI